jgi:hypothetical protein
MLYIFHFLLNLLKLKTNTLLYISQWYLFSINQKPTYSKNSTYDEIKIKILKIKIYLMYNMILIFIIYS